MFYTKYRPQKFSEISKPNEIATALQHQLLAKKTAHAYLFVGSRGTGKTTTARILAKALNCENLDKHGDPCGDCSYCMAIQNGSFLDLIEIDAASNRGIDDIRDLKERIRLSPAMGKKKVYIIDEVHMLTPEAFNALLKTLEEPPAHVTFILCTTEFYKVPDTIKSRCEVFKFKRANLEQLTKKLSDIAKKENIKITETDLKKIASAAHGGFRDAETLLQQVGEGDINIDSILSGGTKQSYIEFLDYLLANEPLKALKRIEKLVEDGVDLFVWSGEFIRYIRELLCLKAGYKHEDFDMTDDLYAKVDKQLRVLDFKGIQLIAESMITAQGNIKNIFVPQLALELAVVKICREITGEETTQKSIDKTPIKPDPKKQKSKEASPGVSEDTKAIIEESSISVEITELTEISEKNEEVQLASNIREVTLEEINSNWKTLIKEVSQINNTISALLKTASATDIKENQVILEVPFDFHKERLENAKNRKVVEATLSGILEKDLSIKCVVKKQTKKLSEKETGKLTDYNVMVPTGVSSQDLKENILEIFDGGLPFS